VPQSDARVQMCHGTKWGQDHDHDHDTFALQMSHGTTKRCATMPCNTLKLLELCVKASIYICTQKAVAPR
jgi:hypothetical protein